MKNEFKYKPCCGRRCLLGSCETRESGGCYCLCRLKDHENTLNDLLSGKVFQKDVGIIYIPNKTQIPLTGEEREEIIKKLEKLKIKLKEYEILSN